ncbi:zinc-binding dehydrogenase [Demequina flava]|uniref:zinc-binding dehydrogenase n=1 Tax=Demequina flava TaxID=1095025 RepID=UPI0007829FB6|nr:zinc-binding dehydrogenase [Demequina flava]
MSTPIPATMRAMRLTAHGGLDRLEEAQVPVPEPQPGEVLVKITAAALNNTDIWTREGAYGLPGDPDAVAGWLGPVDFPRISGADAAGTVVAVGSAGDEGLVGARVVLDPATYGEKGTLVGLMGSERDGAYAEYVTSPATHVYDVTGSPLSDAQLASLPIAYGTATGMVVRGRVAAGETVLVSGASGGVGLAAVQLAKARGAHVVAISSGSKIDEVRAAGADEVVDRGSDVLSQVKQVAPGGIDVVIDVVAGDLLSQGLETLRENGRWVVAGALGGYDVHFDVRRLYLANLQVIGSTMHTPAQFAELMDLARTGDISPVIARTYPLAEAAAAQEELATRGHVGKIVLMQ